VSELVFQLFGTNLPKKYVVINHIKEFSAFIEPFKFLSVFMNTSHRTIT